MFQSASLENPHFNMFTLDRPTGVRNRLSAFLVDQGFSAPAGRCSSAPSSRSLHNSMPAAFALVLMGSVHLIKLFSDFRHGTTPRCPLSGCLWSVVCRARSQRRATALMMSGGAIQAATGELFVFVGFRQPVIRLPCRHSDDLAITQTTLPSLRRPCRHSDDIAVTQITLPSLRRPCRHSNDLVVTQITLPSLRLPCHHSDDLAVTQMTLPSLR